MLKYFWVLKCRDVRKIFFYLRENVFDLLPEIGILRTEPCSTPMDPNIHLTGYYKHCKTPRSAQD